MYGAPRFGAATRYRNVDIGSRVEGASPHRLIAVLFEELDKAIQTTLAALRQGDVVKRAARQSRALSILHALEASLDHEKGGEIAAGLATIYREARRLIVAGAQEDDPERIEKARDMVGEIAEAWARIG